MTRKEAIARKRSLQMQIRMNQTYAGYSSMANGYTKSERLQVIDKCQKELESLVIPSVKNVLSHYQVFVNNDFEGCIYKEQTLEDELTESGAKEFAFSLLNHNNFKLKPVYKQVEIN